MEWQRKGNGFLAGLLVRLHEREVLGPGTTQKRLYVLNQ